MRRGVLIKDNRIIMNGYYDKYGKPLKLMEWAELMGDYEYKRVNITKLWWGGIVSTIWIGMNHSFLSTETPLTFETMVFGWVGSNGFRNSLDQNRYSGLAEARNGHIEMAKKWNRNTVSKTVISELYNRITNRIKGINNRIKGIANRIITVS